MGVTGVAWKVKLEFENWHSVSPSQGLTDLQIHGETERQGTIKVSMLGAVLT